MKTTPIQCPHCSQKILRQKRQIKGTDTYLDQCDNCQRLYRISVDKRQTHTQDNRQSKPL